MIFTHSMIMEQLKEYSNPKAKLGRLVDVGKYTPIIRGLYETDPDTKSYLLAGSIYGPSYISFDFALSYYGMIPEKAYTVTSATYDKKKKRSYDTAFGHFEYRDVPSKVYPLGIILLSEGDYTFQIASREKALCDKLYTLHPVKNQNDMYVLLKEDLRIDDDTLNSLVLEDVRILSEAYHSTNVEILYRMLRRLQK